MVGDNRTTLLSGYILEEEIELTLADLCEACSIHAERVVELVEEGVLEPVGPNTTKWRFSGVSLRRARTALRLQHDLEVNLAGVALILDLMDEIASLKAQLNRKRREV